MKDKNSSKINTLNQHNPWINNNNAIWLASTLSLSRNFDKFKFASKLPTDRRKQVISLITNSLEQPDLLNNPSVIFSEDIAPLEKEFLFEHFLTTQSFQQAHSGEAFIIDQAGDFLATVNIRDHLHLQLTDCQGDIESSWHRIAKIETELGKQVKYAFSTKFGFLTADPNECGTGLTVSTYIQPSAMVHTEKIDSYLENIIDDAIAITGLYGDPNEIVGDILAIRNHCTLGLTEEQILSVVRSFTTKLMIEEKNCRTILRKSGDPEIKDRVSRAFGVLVHSYQIEAIEALNAISLLKLGLDLGWLTGTSMAGLNELFFKCRRAHLLTEQGKKISQEDLPHKRAEFVHHMLKEAKLTI
jgi:protein arginine kinase